jgi:flagellar hook-associated protein 1
MSSALSDTTTAGTAVAGPPAGFSVNTSNIAPGNTINLTYTDTGTNTQRQISIVNVTDPTALPLPNAPNANPKQIGINFSAGAASVAAQLSAALAGTGVSATGTGSTLSLTGSAQSTVTAASTTTTATSLAGGSAQRSLFTDGNSLYTGAITGNGSQMTGYAGRITVNPALLNNPSNLSVYSTSPATQPADTTRSDFLYSQLTTGSFSYSPTTGLGTTAKPFSGTITGFMQQFLSQQANAASSATQLQQGQDVVVSTLQQKFNSVAGVSIDTEMSNLIALQNSYAANAHVMSVVQSMMNTLLQAQV